MFLYLSSLGVHALSDLAASPLLALECHWTQCPTKLAPSGAVSVLPSKAENLKPHQVNPQPSR
jgi:hypothetical protein